jgi:Fic family protein
MSAVGYHEGRFPPASLDWARLIPILGPASAAIARYDGMLAAIPNSSVLLSPLTTQEAVLSSRIEGTQATMGEVLEFEAGQEASSPERHSDIQEVLNYRAAMHAAERRLAELPLSQRLIRETHRVLLAGVRGQNRAPGEYRRTPNWIGAPDCTIEEAEARFVPVAADKLPNAMSAWEQYIHSEPPDRLIQLAILHAEFEALHPFLDGNGRLGRMLVPLFLWQYGLIGKPMFYISDYLEANREGYYERLLAVSRDDDWTGWCQFFLEAVRIQVESNLAVAKSILELYETMKLRMAEMTRSQYAIHALNWIFERPIFRSSHFVSSAGIPEPTARRILGVLREHGVLRVIVAGRGRRAAILTFSELLNMAEGRTAF